MKMNVDTSVNEKFMKRAVELSRIKMMEGLGGPFGAVVVCDGKIVGEGWNKVLSTKDPTAHAEVEAIRAASKALDKFDLNGCILYTSCEPCPMCLTAAMWARIETVYYTNSREDAAQAGFDDSKFYEQVALAPDQREIKMILVKDVDGIKAFQEWKTSPGYTPY